MYSLFIRFGLTLTDSILSRWRCWFNRPGRFFMEFIPLGLSEIIRWLLQSNMFGFFFSADLVGDKNHVQYVLCCQYLFCCNACFTCLNISAAINIYLVSKKKRPINSHALPSWPITISNVWDTFDLRERYFPSQLEIFAASSKLLLGDFSRKRCYISLPVIKNKRTKR